MTALLVRLAKLALIALAVLAPLRGRASYDREIQAKWQQDVAGHTREADANGPAVLER